MRENRRGARQETPPPSPVSEAVVSATPEATVFAARGERQRDVLKTLEEGAEAILTSEGFAAWLATLAKFHGYSFNNVTLIHAQRPDATLVNSYGRWQALNRQVRKGERGIKIFFPVFRKVEDPETREEERKLVSFGIGAVFDLAQTDGDPLPDAPAVTEDTGTDDTATTVNLKLSRFLMDEGIRLSTEPMAGSMRGSWSPTGRKIALRASAEVGPFAVGPTRTLVHEAAHFLADHRGRIDRRDAEAVAEGSAYATMGHFGVDVGETSFPYIAGWARDAEVLRRNLGEIQKVSNALITAIEGVGDPYADGHGSFDRADPWGPVRNLLLDREREDGHLEREWEDRASADTRGDRHFLSGTTSVIFVGPTPDRPL